MNLTLLKGHADVKPHTAQVKQKAELNINPYLFTSLVSVSQISTEFRYFLVTSLKPPVIITIRLLVKGFRILAQAAASLAMPVNKVWIEKEVVVE